MKTCYSFEEKWLDLIVVGGGISGVSVAYHYSKLNQEGNVLILEAESSLACGITSQNANHFWPDEDNLLEMQCMKDIVEVMGIGHNEGTENCSAFVFVQEKEQGINLFEGVSSVSGKECDGNPWVNKIAFPSIYCTQHPMAFDSVAFTEILANKCGNNVSCLLDCQVQTIVDSETHHSVTANSTKFGTISLKCTQVVVATNSFIPLLLPALKPYISTVKNEIFRFQVKELQKQPPPFTMFSCGFGDDEFYGTVDLKTSCIVVGGPVDKLIHWATKVAFPEILNGIEPSHSWQASYCITT